jgi:hypothetical protein
MTFVVLGICQALATYAFVTTAASVLVYSLWRADQSETASAEARSRAEGLFLLRLLPMILGLVVTIGIGWSAFMTFEPRDTTESVGIVIGLAGSFGACLILSGVTRMWLAWHATQSIVEGWRSSATPIDLPGAEVPVFRLDSPLPIVSIVGVRHPRLFVAGTVLHHCTPSQIEAIVAHESSHVAAGDNFRRLLLRGSADPLAFVSIGGDIERAWADATEEAADDSAVGEHAVARCELADALVRVARLASGRSLADVAGATLSRGLVAHRVHRLLAGDRAAGRSPSWLTATRILAYGAPIVATLCVLHPTSLRDVHEAVEVLQRVLP